MSFLLASAAAAAMITQQQSINTYLPTNFDDASFTVRVQNPNFAELAKVNKDFSQSYRFKTSQVWIKEPFKLKMVSTVEDTTITFLVVDGRKQTRIPRSNLNLSEDVSGKPGKRQTGFDFGILTPAMFTGFLDAKFVRMDRATNDAVFDLTFEAKLKDTTRYRVWIDPEKRVVTKKEWYGQQSTTNGRLMATFTYANPKQFGSVWVNTKAVVSNSDGKVGGAAMYEGMKVNSGLADSVFKL